MDTDYFASIVRSLTVTPSRRAVGRAIAGLAAGSYLAPLIGAMDVEAKKKKKKRKKKPPPPPPPGGPCYATVRPGEDLQAVLIAAAGDVNGTAPICLTAGTYVLTGMSPSDFSEDLELYGATLVGAGQGQTILQGSGTRGVLSSGFGGQLKDLTITGGVKEKGGGGGINLGGDLTMTNCTVTGNRAEVGGGILIAVLSHLVLDGCTITGNMAHNDDGDGQGGGVINFGTLTRTNTTISGNTSDVGPDCFDDIGATGC